jgi:hypothetical protein
MIVKILVNFGGLSEIELSVSDSIYLNKQTYGGYCSQINNQAQ